MTWQKLSSKTVYKNRYMVIAEDQMLTDHGDKLTYGIVRKEPFSIVIPWDGEKTLLVGQYRVTADIFSWEFSMGHAETDSPIVAAKRELQEETGLIADKLIEIGSFYPALGTMNQKGYVYVAHSWIIGQRDLEPSEKDMQMRWVTLLELNQLIMDGTITDGPTITSFKFFELYLQTHPDVVQSTHA